MLPNRQRVSRDSAEVLKQLKGRTGVTPNVLCRIALMLSLRDGRKTDLLEQELNGLEFNSSTLFGEYAALYDCVVQQLYGPANVNSLEQILAYHISDGLMRLRGIRSISELAAIS